MRAKKAQVEGDDSRSGLVCVLRKGFFDYRYTTTLSAIIGNQEACTCMQSQPGWFLSGGGSKGEREVDSESEWIEWSPMMTLMLLMMNPKYAIFSA